MKKNLFENYRFYIKEAEVAPAGAAGPVPGDAPAKDQVHLFDFDDTLGITTNANGVMPFMNGKPAISDENQARQWMKQYGLTDADLLSPKFEKVPERGNGIVIYLTSAGLAKMQSVVPKAKQFATGFGEPPAEGDAVLIDFSPSSNTNVKTTKPIPSTINKLKQANAAGAKTAVVTARTAGGEVTDIHGKKLNATNAQDMEKFLSAQGAKPNAGVFGVTGGNKGDKIIKTFVNGAGTPPKEVHFYDDLSKNTSDVENAFKTEKTPAELFVYGPGEFAHGQADPNKPNARIPASEKAIKEKIRRMVREHLAKITKKSK